jgi:hypothetical protein
MTYTKKILFLIPLFLAIWQPCSAQTGVIIPKGDESVGIDPNRTITSGPLTLPDSLIAIGDKAFKDYELTGPLKLPPNLIVIRSGAFQNCSGLTGDLIIPETVIEISTDIFKNCSGFNGRLSLPDGLEQIPGSSFYNCSGLQGELKLPTALKNMYWDAFYGCSGFTGELVIPENLTYVCGRSFMNCSGFSSVRIHKDVSNIGEKAFAGCTGLETFRIMTEYPPMIQEHAFKDVHNVTLLVPPGCVDNYDQAPWNDKTIFSSIQEDPDLIVSESEHRYSQIGYNRSYEGLKFRFYHNLEATVIGIIPYGEKLEVSSSQDYEESEIDKDVLEDWSRIRWNGMEGWVFNDFISYYPLAPGSSIHPVSPTTANISGTWYSINPFLAEGYDFTKGEDFDSEYSFLNYPVLYNYNGTYEAFGFEYREEGKWSLSGHTITEKGIAGFYEFTKYTVQYTISLYQMNSGIYVMERCHTKPNGKFYFTYLVKGPGKEGMSSR